MGPWADMAGSPLIFEFSGGAALGAYWRGRWVLEKSLSWLALWTAILLLITTEMFALVRDSGYQFLLLSVLIVAAALSLEKGGFASLESRWTPKLGQI